MRRQIFIFLCFCAIGSLASAQESALQEAVKLPEMNGIKYSDYKDFFNWEMVTVRYRRDNSEQRFIYANKAAAEALRKSSKDYPDGAVFAKIGYVGEDDPAFTSSVVPSGSRRVQYMVRDHKKYQETDGWGYAKFKMDGTFPDENPKSMALACAACHRIVPDRGMVFAQFIDKSPIAQRAPPKSAELENLFKNKTLPAEPADRIKFLDQPTKGIPEAHLMRVLLPKRFKVVRMVDHEIAKYHFTGGYGMIIPTLIQEVIRSGKPATMIGQNFDRKSFSLVYMLNAQEMAADQTLKCEKNEKAVFIALSIPPFYLPTSHLPSSANLEIRRLCVVKKAP